MRIRYINLH